MQGDKQRRCRRALGCEWGGISSGTCLVVLMTRMELEHVSEIALLQKPMRALRKRNMGSSVLRS